MRIWISDGNRHTNPESGYGQNSVAFARGLRGLGHDVRFEFFTEADVCLFICPPYSIRETPIRPAAAYSVHELETLTPQKATWPDILNRLDLLITATEWNRLVWRKLGVTIPIEVVPEGVDTDAYYPPTGRECVFLCVHSNLGSPSSRELWSDTLLAYWGEFRQEDRVRLVIKTWSWRPAVWQEHVDRFALELGIDREELPPIQVIDDRLSDSDMRQLYHSAWLFLKNADREGWSLPCTEAIACGRPVAATLIQPLKSLLPLGTRWFEPGDVSGLRAIMRTEYESFCEKERDSLLYPASAMGPNMEAVLKRLVPH